MWISKSPELDHLWPFNFDEIWWDVKCVRAEKYVLSWLKEIQVQVLVQWSGKREELVNLDLSFNLIHYTFSMVICVQKCLLINVLIFFAIAGSPELDCEVFWPRLHEMYCFCNCFFFCKMSTGFFLKVKYFEHFGS